MGEILPAGMHNGTILQSWSSSRLFVCHIAYRGRTAYAEHANEPPTIITVQKGCCLKRMGNERLSLAAGSMLFIPAGYVQADSFPVATTFFAAELSTALLERVKEIREVSSRYLNVVYEDAQDVQLRLWRELMAPDDFSELVFEALLIDMLVCTQRTNTSRPKHPPIWLTQAKDLLHDCAFQTVRIEEIATTLGVHPAQLCREFRRFFHRTPGDYIRRLRIEHARQQLQRTDLRLVDIAVESGFADHAHFARTFRRYTGYSPKHYRRLLRTKSAIRQIQDM
jgi:AraC family transcriptional regulator